MDRAVSIVIPCFNEGPRILATLSTVEGWFSSPPQLVVVDDGSTDDTGEQLRRYAARHPHVLVQTLPRNSGKGAAIRSAIPIVCSDRVIVMDADLAFDRASVFAILDALDSAEIAVGNRRHERSRYSVRVRLFGFLYRRHVVGLAFNAVVRGLLQVGLRDTQCGLKGFRRDTLQRIGRSLTTNGFAVDVEILLIARALGVHVHDVPVFVTYDSAMSSVRLLQSAVVMSRDLLRLFLRRAAGFYRPERVSGVATPGSR